MTSKSIALLSTTLEFMELLLLLFAPPVARCTVMIGMFQSCASARTYPAVVFVMPPSMDSWRFGATLDVILDRGLILAPALSVLGSITVPVPNMGGHGF